MAMGGHGLPKVSPGPAMPDPSTPCRRASPETALRSFQGWPMTSPQGWWPSSTPLDTPRRTQFLSYLFLLQSVFHIPPSSCQYLTTPLLPPVIREPLPSSPPNLTTPLPVARHPPHPFTALPGPYLPSPPVTITVTSFLHLSSPSHLAIVSCKPQLLPKLPPLLHYSSIHSPSSLENFILDRVSTYSNYRLATPLGMNSSVVISL
jgi:hypothetical protein